MEIDEEIEVRCANELNFGTYISRTLHVQKDVNRWTIRHLQFVDWPDFGCPKDTRSLLEFCKIMRDYMSDSDGLALVHCRYVLLFNLFLKFYNSQFFFLFLCIKIILIKIVNSSY